MSELEEAVEKAKCLQEKVLNNRMLHYQPYEYQKNFTTNCPAKDY